jgi:hypothetical protein
MLAQAIAISRSFVRKPLRLRLALRFRVFSPGAHLFQERDSHSAKTSQAHRQE